MSVLRVNGTKITAKNAFNPDHLWMEGKHESKKPRLSLLLGIFANSWVGP